jgi:hypothetical protein
VPPKGKKYTDEGLENELNKFIEKRAREVRDANWRSRIWANSLKDYNLRQAAQHREEWIAFHRGLEQLHSKLAREHDEAAKRLEAEVLA